MFILQIIRMALKGLTTNFFRSLLATLGVVIGVGAVVAAVSILEGAQRDVMDSIESLGADQIFVLNGQQEHGGRHEMINSLTLEDADAMMADDSGHIRAVAPQVTGGGQIKRYAKNVFATILGTSPDYATINDYHVAAGRFISEPDLRAQAMVAVLGHRVAEELFGFQPALGESVKINLKSFTVVGVMEEKGSLGFVDVDNQVFIPVTTGVHRFFGVENLQSIVVQAADAHNLDPTKERISRILRQQHRIRAGSDDDFQLFTQESIKQRVKQFALLFAVVFYSIAGISLVVGGIGIMNIMTVSVTERTREIGVRMAVGARRFDILWQFLLEAAIISLVGGALGLVFGWAIGDLLSSITEVLKVYTPPGAILVALVMAGTVGIVSGIYPAIRASQLDPVTALRYE